MIEQGGIGLMSEESALLRDYWLIICVLIEAVHHHIIIRVKYNVS
jgi:hypothetical protein